MSSKTGFLHIHQKNLFHLTLNISKSCGLPGLFSAGTSLSSLSLGSLVSTAANGERERLLSDLRGLDSFMHCGLPVGSPSGFGQERVRTHGGSVEGLDEWWSFRFFWKKVWRLANGLAKLKEAPL